MLYIWIAIFAVMVIVELCTVQLVSIWFAVGALASVIASLCGVEQLWIQILIFVGVSAAALIATRPFLKKITKAKKLPTNADMVIGSSGVAVMTIDNLKGEGQVSVKGSIWSARSADDSVIEEGSKVTVKYIEGVKLFVEKI